MTPILKRLVAISLSVIMALTLFPLIGGAFYGQTAFADDEIVQDDGDVGGGDVVNEEEPEVLDENAPTGENPKGDVYKDETAGNEGAKSPKGDQKSAINIWTEDEVWDLYSDGNKEIVVNPEYEGTLVIRVGTGFVRNNDAETLAEWEDQFTGDLLSEGTYYDYDEDCETLTLYGESIYNRIHGSYNQITIAAALIDDEMVSDYSLISDKDNRTIEVKKPYTKYSVEWEEWDEYENYWGMVDEPQGSLTMLKGLDMAIYEDVEAVAYSAYSPGGENYDCPVTNVEASGDPDDPIIEVNHKKYNGEWYWVLTPVSEGETTVTVSFEDEEINEVITKEYDVTVAGERVVVYNVGCKGNNEGVPGESIEMRASAFYESNDYLDFENLTFRWWIDEDDTDVAEIAWDEEDSSKATVTFKKVPLNGDNRYITVWAEATYINEEGDAVVGKGSNVDEVFLCAERYVITPTPEEVGLIDIKQSIEYEPQLLRVYFDGSVEEEQIEDVEFDVSLDYRGKYNKKKKKWTHKSWWATNHNNGTWTIKRYDGHWTNLNVYAYSEDIDIDDEPYECYHFDTIRTNLSKYQIKFVDAEDYYGDPYYCIDDSNEGITPEVIVYDDYYAEYEEDAYVVPADQYTIKVEKRNAKGKYVSSKMPLKFNKNEVDLGAYDNGSATYRVYAVAKKKNSHGFTKNTPKADGEVLIYSDCTLTPVAGSVAVDSDFDQYKSKDEYDDNYGYRYDFPLDPSVQLTASDYRVNANGGKDTLTTASYKVQYIDQGTGETLDAFPTTTGKYNVVVTGQGAYFGQHDLLVFYVGEKNPLSVEATTKTVEVKKLKKKPQTVTPVTVGEGAVGDITYSLYGNSKLKINKTTGKVTVAKKTKKGTYRAWVYVHAAGDETYAPEDKSVRITIKVK